MTVRLLDFKNILNIAKLYFKARRQSLDLLIVVTNPYMGEYYVSGTISNPDFLSEIFYNMSIELRKAAGEKEISPKHWSNPNIKVEDESE